MSAPVAAATAPHVEHEGFSVRSNSGTVEDLQRDLGVDVPDPSPPVETNTDPGDEDPETPAEPKVKAREKHDRIQQLTYEREEAKREAEAIKAENARLKAERERPTERADPRRTEDEQTRYEHWKAGYDDADPKPQVADFEDHDAYLDARDAHAERRFERKAERAAQERQHAERQQRVEAAATTFNTRMQAEAAKDAAFGDLIKRVQIPQGPILDVFLTTDIPEALARYLDANPDKLRALVHMRPGQQLAEIKRIEGRVEAELEARTKAAPADQPKPVKTTNAHPPINPVVGSHVAASDEEPGDDAPDEEYYAWHKRHSKGKQ